VFPFIFAASSEEMQIMADSVTLVTQKREPDGSAGAQRLRKRGLIPAVLYGHKEETVALAIPQEDFATILRHHTRVVDLDNAGKKEKALIREVQWDHLGHDVLHVDFYRVAADERIKIDVRLELRGIAPGATGGGVLDQPLHSLHIECPAVSVPESIRVNVGELQVGQAIHVRDLHLPEGVTVLNDPDAIVVHVTAPAAEPEAPVAPAAETAEPEVIGRAKAEAEEGE
jgi:large subunit ribosomal protein L25